MSIRRCFLGLVLTALPAAAPAQQVPFGDLPPGVVRPSVGCGASGHDETSRRSCWVKELRYADDSLNARYQELRKKLTGGETSALQNTQRAWLKDRDASCNVESRIQDRAKWLAHVAESENRAACVLRMTEIRLADIEKMQQQLLSTGVTAQIVPQAGAPAAVPQTEGSASGPVDDEYLVRSAHSRRSGKYYFEVVVDQGRIRDKLEADLVARVNDGQRWVGTSHNIRPQNVVLNLGPDSSVVIEGGNLGDIRLPKVVMGVAVDLDAGILYRHRDGAWLGGAAPGSPKGIPLRRDAEFRAELSSSVRLKPLFDQGIVAVNFGASRFDRGPPAGYLAFDAKQSADDTGSAAARPGFFPPRQQVAGVAQEQWIRQYWEWARSFPGEESPSADATGHRCGAGQSGPVWFLTGSRQPKPVQRECEVPPGKVVLVPIVNTLAQVNPGEQVTCDRLLVSLRQFAAGTTDLRLKVDGVAVEKPERFLLGTGCFNLRDASSGHSGLAAGTGYWVFIRPLQKGRHELEFGGIFSLHGFRQDIRYVLHVR